MSINADEPLYRLIPLNPTLLTYDPSLRRIRPSSGLFVNSKPDPNFDRVTEGKSEQYLSIYIQSTLRSINISDDKVIEPGEKYGGITFLAASVYSNPGNDKPMQRVFQEPLAPPPTRQPAHGGVAGQKSSAARQLFAEKSSWVIGPPIEWLEHYRNQLKIPMSINISESYSSLLGQDA